MDALRDVFSFTSDQHPEASLRVVSFRGDEEMNGLYTFHLDLLGALDGDMLARLDDSLLGRAATLAFAEASAPGRVVHGHVTAYRIGDTTERGSIVHAELRPRLALLELRTKSRIFQDKSVKDVVDAIFAEWRVDHEWHLALPHALRTYCTQYQETDLSFVARLLASEGIAFYFVHPTDAGKEERVVLVDEPQYPPIEVGGGAKGAPPALVHRSGRFDPGAGDVFEVTTDRRMRHGAARLGDYDFRKPKLVVRALKLAKDEPARALAQRPQQRRRVLCVERIVERREVERDQREPAAQRDQIDAHDGPQPPALRQAARRHGAERAARIDERAEGERLPARAASRREVQGDGLGA